jgi:transcriptional regulator with XRE-family HTH domain
MTGVGDLLREWRQRRHLSQLDLAIEAGISSRHLSFVETGRAKPTSEMILRLAAQLDVPLRDRNKLLLAGGYAPAYPEHAMTEPELRAVRTALASVLKGHEPYPAALINRHWELVDANAPIALFTSGAAPHLLEPPVNVLRLSLHPEGMAPRILNLAQWRAHLLDRLQRQVRATGDPVLAGLHAELTGYPGGPEASQPAETAHPVVPLRYRSMDSGDLSFISITAVLGTPMDVTVEELVIESFYPADGQTARALRRAPLHHSRHLHPSLRQHLFWQGTGKSGRYLSHFVAREMPKQLLPYG